MQTALIYGIVYASFEVFPLIYPPIYHFSLGATSLTFLTSGAGCMFGVMFFLMYQYWYLIPDIKVNGFRAPEHRLVPALLGVVLSPVGYFLFGCEWRTHLSQRPTYTRSRDFASKDPLDRLTHRPNHLRHGELLDFPVRLHLPPPLVPALRRKSLRHERSV
jgi:hypothetical protein